MIKVLCKNCSNKTIDNKCSLNGLPIQPEDHGCKHGVIKPMYKHIYYIKCTSEIFERIELISSSIFIELINNKFITGTYFVEAVNVDCTEWFNKQLIQEN